MNFAIGAVSFILGSALTYNYLKLRANRRKTDDRENAGACREYNDLSLFYGDEDTLTSTTKTATKMPDNFYGQLVKYCIIPCVDCLIVRVNKQTDKRECILVERGEEPAKGKWWLPGGRILKGETFFKAALRKCKTETGLVGTPVQILGIYNTFFDSSAWDDARSKGTQTINSIVLIEVADGSEVTLDDTSNRYRWISIDPATAEATEEDKYIVLALQRMKAWRNTL